MNVHELLRLPQTEHDDTAARADHLREQIERLTTALAEARLVKLTATLLADTRTGTNGPSGTERCGRAAMSSTQNEKAFSSYPAPEWRLLDGDGFFVTLPGYEHCPSTATTCTWKKIG
ncbi:hypothetical protein ABT147_39080 [Streptomyces sp. NPDC001868]|uniref:hypothetical protein n=1 Tax=Streptomyces sp. NPDC001868 TaxID=3154401 RepID=UPI00332E60DF